MNDRFSPRHHLAISAAVGALLARHIRRPEETELPLVHLNGPTADNMPDLTDVRFKGPLPRDTEFSATIEPPLPPLPPSHPAPPAALITQVRSAAGDYGNRAARRREKFGRR